MIISHVTVIIQLTIDMLCVTSTYNMYVRACNVGANLLYVVSRTFPHFPQSMLTTIYVNEPQFGGGKTFLGHNLNIPTYTYFYVQGELYFLRFILHVLRGLCSFDDLQTVDHEACQQRPDRSAGSPKTIAITTRL